MASSSCPVGGSPLSAKGPSVKLLTAAFELGILSNSPTRDEIQRALSNTKDAKKHTLHPISRARFLFWGYGRTKDSHAAQEAHAKSPTEPPTHHMELVRAFFSPHFASRFSWPSSLHRCGGVPWPLLAPWPLSLPSAWHPPAVLFVNLKSKAAEAPAPAEQAPASAAAAGLTKW